jgi:hypothetical protein
MFPLTSASRPALGPTQPPGQGVPGALSPGVKRGRGVILVPRLRKSRSCTSCHPNAALWSVTGPLYLFFTYTAFQENRRGYKVSTDSILRSLNSCKFYSTDCREWMDHVVVKEPRNGYHKNWHLARK